MFLFLLMLTAGPVTPAPHSPTFPFPLMPGREDPASLAFTGSFGARSSLALSYGVAGSDVRLMYADGVPRAETTQTFRLMQTEWERLSLTTGLSGVLRYERYLGHGVAVQGEASPVGGYRLGVRWYVIEGITFTWDVDPSGGMTVGWQVEP